LILVRKTEIGRSPKQKNKNQENKGAVHRRETVIKEWAVARPTPRRNVKHEQRRKRECFSERLPAWEIHQTKKERKRGQLRYSWRVMRNEVQWNVDAHAVSTQQGKKKKLSKIRKAVPERFSTSKKREEIEHLPLKSREGGRLRARQGRKSKELKALGLRL